MEPNLANIPNPFDFANPVRLEKLFVGRSAELADIRYYLDQAALREMAVNLALVGERAAGKTSFLNIIELEAKKRGFCVARIDLDEGDSASQLAFFQKIFDSLFTAACLKGAYEGLGGKTYECYREMVDALSIPSERLFCPFGFPIQFAKAMGGQNPMVSVSSEAFKHDVSAIQEAVGGPLALLFDEGNVLAGSKIHLEKLRNIFMNIPGVMLVLTGTASLFPVMDDVFSPIVRQFKKINVEPFNQSDTRKCIEDTLRSVEDAGHFTVGEWIEDLDIEEVRALTGGRPYEIQLVCHFMFRRIQEGRARKFELGTAVLDDVRRELEKTQDVSARPILGAIARYTEKELEALGRFTRADRGLSFQQAWFLTDLFDEKATWTKANLQEKFEMFVHDGVLRVESGNVAFAGDDFDRIYANYLARQRGSGLTINSFPFPLALFFHLDYYLRSSGGHMADWILFEEGPAAHAPEASQTGTADHLLDLAQAFASEESDPLESDPAAAARLYRLSVRFRRQGSFSVARVSLQMPWEALDFEFSEGVPNSEGFLEKITTAVDRLDTRAGAHDARVILTTALIPAVPPDVLARHLDETVNLALRRDLADWHGGEMSDAHLSSESTDDPSFHAPFAARFGSPETANNAGYLYLVTNQHEKARIALNKALEDGNDETRALASYNLGIIEAQAGNKEKAVRLLEQVKGLAPGDPMACLLVPKKTGETEGLEFEEVMGPDLTEAAEKTLQALR